MHARAVVEDSGARFWRLVVLYKSTEIYGDSDCIVLRCDSERWCPTRIFVQKSRDHGITWRRRDDVVLPWQRRKPLDWFITTSVGSAPARSRPLGCRDTDGCHGKAVGRCADGCQSGMSSESFHLRLRDVTLTMVTDNAVWIAEASTTATYWMPVSHIPIKL